MSCGFHAHRILFAQFLNEQRIATLLWKSACFICSKKFKWSDSGGKKKKGCQSTMQFLLCRGNCALITFKV